jgi:hypothetical protein
MEKFINKKIKSYIGDFKSELKTKAIELFIPNTKSITDSKPVSEQEQKVNDFVQFMFEYECLCLTKEDVSKRKRIKNAIPSSNRCIAKRANGEQCTRKQKEGHEFCGTHVKGIPHGVVVQNENVLSEGETVRSEVFAKDIHGIVYYIDQYNNVYKTEDILNEKKNPEIIAKCEIIRGEYSIPAFGLTS